MDRHWLVEVADAGARLDKFLASEGRLGSRGRAAEALARGKIFLNDHEVTPKDAGVMLAEGDVVRVWMDRPGSSRRRQTLGTERDLPIVFEDQAIVVLNKPAGVLAVPLARRSGARSVYDDLVKHFDRRRQRRPLVVHRIDRDTSGLVVFAKTARAQRALEAQFLRHTPKRVYFAVVYGHPSPSAGEWRDHLVWDDRALIQKPTHRRDPKGTEAVSRYRVVESFRRASLIEVTLVTGLRNQIRLQAQLRGHPLVGESQYADGSESLRTIPFPRQALHAHHLAFRHPEDGRPVEFEAAMPDDMRGLVRRLKSGHGP